MVRARLDRHGHDVDTTGDGFRATVESAAVGCAVHLATRVMAAAAPSEVLVTSMTRSMVDARLFRFVDRGPHQLKGFPESVELSVLVERTGEAAER